LGFLRGTGRSGCVLSMTWIRGVEEIADSTHRKRMQGLAARINRQPTGKLKGHSERGGVDPTGLQEEAESYLRRFSFWSVRIRLSLRISPGKEHRGPALRRDQDGNAAARRVRLSVGWLRFILPLDGHARNTQPAQECRDFLRSLLGDSGLLDETVPVR
jgi:hypothetical protein